jgi:hypothetical protein
VGSGSDDRQSRSRYTSHAIGRLPLATDRFRPETVKAVEVVEHALRLARGDVGDVTSKGGRDLVTATDVAVEDAEGELLTGALGLPVVGEERGGDAPRDGSAYWLVDRASNVLILASRSAM